MQSSFKKHKKQGFSMVELLVAVTLVAVLSTVAFLGAQGVSRFLKNNRVASDLLAIGNALEQYQRDNGAFPDLSAGGTMNVLCFNADATYSHDCDSAAFRQAMIGNGLLGKTYLQKVPLDPYTGSRYVYGVSSDGKFYQVAGVFRSITGSQAKTVGNLGRGFYLPALLRAYNGPNFVTDRGEYLPYSPSGELTAQLRNVVGTVSVSRDSSNVDVADTLVAGDTITTNAGAEADIYFSDGSVSHLEPSSTLELNELSFGTNDAKSTESNVSLKLTAGKIWNKVVRLASKSQFRVETTNAIAGVRGTEFGVITDGTDDTFVVTSGAINIDDINTNNALEIAPTNGALQATVTSVSFPSQSSTVASDSVADKLIQDNQQNPLHEGVTPYVLDLDIPTGGLNFVMRVGMNSLNSTSYNIDGFEVYKKSDFIDERKLAAAASATDTPKYNDGAQTPYFSYNQNSQLYELTFALPTASNSRYQQDGLSVRAYQGSGSTKTYSNLSWPPIGFDVPTGSRTYRPDFRDVYPELVALNAGGPRLNVSAPNSVMIPPSSTGQDFNLNFDVSNLEGTSTADYKVTPTDSNICSVKNSGEDTGTVNGTGITIPITATTAGTCTLDINATLPNNAIKTRTVDVIVSNETNQPPIGIIEVKNAQGDVLGTTEGGSNTPTVQVIQGEEITLDAGASRDPNTGDSLSYSWYTVGSSGMPTQLDKTSGSITANTSSAGSITYRVKVADSTNLTDTADIILTAELGNIAPTADFEFESTGIGTLTTDPSTGNATLTLTATDDVAQVTVKANANGTNYQSSDTDGTIASYAWISGVSSQQSDATTSINGTPGAAVQDIGFFVPDATTTDQTYMYNYALTVIDDGGKSSTKTKFLTVVREANISLQSIAVTGPATITSGATAATASYTATGTYSDSSQDITSQCAWSVTGTSGPTISAGTLNVPANYAGSNTVQCDLDGITGTANVAVNSPKLDCENAGGKWVDNSCWVESAVGGNCTDACTTNLTGSYQCNDTGWDDTNFNACSSFYPSITNKASLPSSDPNFETAPYMYQVNATLQICRNRADTTTLLDQCGASTIGFTRFCKCD